MAIRSNLDLLLALLYAQGASGKKGEAVKDTTRLVKLMFLLVKEGGFQELVKDLSFEPHDFGPWAGEIFDGIESLKQIGVINTKNALPESPEELVDDRALVQEFEGIPQPEPSQVTIYQLTRQGTILAGKIFSSLSSKERNQIEIVKKRWNHSRLRDLLEYVYTKYPESTIRSKIKKKILRHSMFGALPDLPEFKREEEDFR